MVSSRPSSLKHEGERCPWELGTVAARCWARPRVRHCWQGQGRRSRDEPPVSTATFADAQNGNGNWRLTAPQTLRLAATDDVSVAKLQYSLDGGATYIDAPIIPGPSVSANVTFSEESNITLRYRAQDSAGNITRGATTNTTLNAASAAGATAVRLTSTTGRGPGDTLVIDTGAAQETATIASLVTPAPAAPAPNVTLDRSAGQRARRGRRGGRHPELPDGPGADRHQGADRDLGHAGDDDRRRPPRPEPRPSGSRAPRAARSVTRSSSTRARTPRP